MGHLRITLWFTQKCNCSSDFCFGFAKDPAVEVLTRFRAGPLESVAASGVDCRLLEGPSSAESESIAAFAVRFLEVYVRMGMKWVSRLW